MTVLVTVKVVRGEKIGQWTDGPYRPMTVFCTAVPVRRYGVQPYTVGFF